MRDPLFDLEGKVAVVTGSTRGLGRSIAEAYARAGARVAISSEDPADCARVEKEMRASGHQVFACPCDVRYEDAQRELIEKTVHEFGALDIVVANAGIPGPMGSILTAEADAYRNLMAINLDSIIRLCALAVPHLKARGGGSLILMSSLSGMRGTRALGAYSLAKAAISQLARNLAVELGDDNIRANAIAPGIIRTELATALTDNHEFMKWRLKLTPLRRIGEPHEIAGPALLLAGKGGTFMTGQTLVVDGGTLITDGS